MGDVYRARDPRLGRIVAIKILRRGLVDAPGLRARFEREAAAIASLSHPHICSVYDVGRQEDIDYLVMEYLEGPRPAWRGAASGELARLCAQPPHSRVSRGTGRESSRRRSLGESGLAKRAGSTMAGCECLRRMHSIMAVAATVCADGDGFEPLFKLDYAHSAIIETCARNAFRQPFRLPP
jgi:protein kinase-like protein